MKLNLTQIILVLIIITKTNASESNECSFNDSSKTYKDNELILLLNFDSFSELQFKCSNPLVTSILALKPNRKLILDDSLNLNGLKIEPTQVEFAILLSDLTGFNLNKNPFRKIQFTNSRVKHILWSIKNTNFDFYHNNISSNNMCDERFFNDTSWQNPIDCYMLFLGSSTKYSTKTCPLAFRNFKSYILNIDKLSGSFIEKNILSFQNLSDNLLERINTTIYQFEVNMYHTDLNTKLLNKHIFKRLISLDLDGQITFIQEDLFKSIKTLRYLRLRLQNIKKIFVYNNKWLNHLNNDINVNPCNADEVEKYRDQILTLVVYQTFYNLTF